MVYFADANSSMMIVLGCRDTLDLFFNASVIMQTIMDDSEVLLKTECDLHSKPHPPYAKV